MKVLIVNSSDIEGGAARAAYRLHQSLLVKGVESQMLVQSKSSDDFSVLGPITKTQKVAQKLRPFIDGLPVRRYKNRTKTLFSPSWVPFSDVVGRINNLDPDIVHIHWIAGGLLRIEDLAKIKAPVVWSLHDNWAFTGGCHIMWDCEKYKSACGSCPRLGSQSENDLSRTTYLRKKKVFTKIKNLTVVGLSGWLANCAKDSSLFESHEVVCLPNPVDVCVYSPFDKGVSRNLLKLPVNKRLIVFGAMGATSDINKGFKELSAALQQLKAEDAELIVFGSSKPETDPGFNQTAHYLGRLHDDVTLRVLYSAADVMVVPSLQENLSNTIMESLACGTPVVAFDVGGNPDLIDHKINGYLARSYSTEDLANGIDWVLQHNLPELLAESARKKILDKFDSKVVAEKYIDLYRKVLSRDN